MPDMTRKYLVRGRGRLGVGVDEGRARGLERTSIIRGEGRVSVRAKGRVRHDEDVPGHGGDVGGVQRADVHAALQHALRAA